MLRIIISYGLIICAIGFIIIIGSQIINARYWLDCYPKSIQQLVEPQTKREKVTKLIIGTPFLFALFVFPEFAIIEYVSTINYTPSFMQILTVAFCTLLIFNLFDLIILDWLIFCYITPSYQIIEGSENKINEYKNYAFHFQGFIKGLFFGLGYSIILSLVTIFNLLGV